MEVTLGVMLLLAAAAGAGRYVSWRGSVLDVPICVFIGVLLLSTLVAGPTRNALDAYRGLWIIGAYPATMLLLRDARHAAVLARILVVCTALVAVYGIVQHFTGVDVYRQMMGRRPLVKAHGGGAGGFEVIGFFPNTLTYGHSLMVPLGLALVRALDRGEVTRRRVEFAVSASLIGAGLLLSTARGAWIAGIAVLLMACSITGGLKRVSVAAGIVVGGAAVLLQSTSLRTDAFSIFDVHATAARAEIYAANLELVS